MSEDVTRLLQEWRAGNNQALDDLLPLVYDELRRLAQFHMSHERDGHILQATALVNEACLRLINQSNIEWQGRAHFFAIASRVMRNLLVDHARSQHNQKRGGGAHQVTLDEGAVVNPEDPTLVLILDQALARLSSFDERKARVVEMRYFGGLSVEETAEVLGISAVTVKREWLKAKAWLYRELNPDVNEPVPT